MSLLPGRWAVTTRQPLDLWLRAGLAGAVVEALAQRVPADPHCTLGRRTALGADRSGGYMLRPAHRAPDSPTRPQPGGPWMSCQRPQQRCLLAAATTTVGCAVGLYNQQVIVLDYVPTWKTFVIVRSTHKTMVWSITSSLVKKNKNITQLDCSNSYVHSLILKL